MTQVVQHKYNHITIKEWFAKQLTVYEIKTNTHHFVCWTPASVICKEENIEIKNEIFIQSTYKYPE